MLTRVIVASLALLLWSCQPSDPCDPGQYEMGGGCYPNAKPEKDSGEPKDEDAGPDAGAAADAGEDAAKPNECPGDPYEGFGTKCAAASECTCHAPNCAMVPLEYCTKYNCDTKDKTSCPSGWTCLMIPPGASPDPSIKSLCLRP
jgi:hypothetical protein